MALHDYKECGTSSVGWESIEPLDEDQEVHTAGILQQFFSLDAELYSLICQSHHYHSLTECNSEQGEWNKRHNGLGCSCGDLPSVQLAKKSCTQLPNGLLDLQDKMGHFAPCEVVLPSPTMYYS